LFADVTLIASQAEDADGGEARIVVRKKCHRAVLASRYDFFKSLFSGRFRESSADEIELSSIAPGVLLPLLDFIYTGNAAAVLNDESAVDVLAASAVLGMDDLFYEAELYVSRRLSKDNAADCVALAKALCLPRLEREARDAAAGRGAAGEEKKEGVD